MVVPDGDYPRRLTIDEFVEEKISEEEMAQVVRPHLQLEAVLRSSVRTHGDTWKSDSFQFLIVIMKVLYDMKINQSFK